MGDDTCILLVLTNAAPGHEDEFNDWYTNRHVYDVAKYFGVPALQRFQLADMSMGNDAPYRFLAIYEVPASKRDEAQKALFWSREERAEAEAAGREPKVPLSPYMEEDRVAWWYEPITERLEFDMDAESVAS